MDFNTIVILVLIGVAAGMLSGFIGVGGGIIIVPSLVYFLGLTQHAAQGTSLGLMLLPIGILAVMNYYKTDNVNVPYAAIIAVTFVVGAYFGSKLSLKLNPNVVKLVFGIIMFYAAIRMIISSVKSLNAN